MEKRKLTTADISLICNSIMEKELELLKELGPKHNPDFHDRFGAVAHRLADGYVDADELTLTDEDITRIVRGYAKREAEIFRALLMMTRPSAEKDRKAAMVVKCNGGEAKDAKGIKHEIDALSGEVPEDEI